MEFMSRVSRVKEFSFVCISLNNGPIFNPIEILKLSQSPLYSSIQFLLHVKSVESKAKINIGVNGVCVVSVESGHFHFDLQCIF